MDNEDNFFIQALLCLKTATTAEQVERVLDAVGETRESLATQLPVFSGKAPVNHPWPLLWGGESE